VHDHGSEFVNRDVAAVIKTHSLIDIKTRPRHPESNGIVERFNGKVRDESDNDYGNYYLQGEAIIAKLMQQYNEAITCDSNLHDAGDLASWAAG
jgi:transposase InsO family protein